MSKQHDTVSSLLRAFLLVLGALVPGRAAADETADRKAQRPQNAEFHVVGYLPHYRMADFDGESCRHLTDLVYFSGVPGPGGELLLTGIKRDDIEKLKKFKARHKIALALCVGGWGKSSAFPKLAASAAARQNFAEAVTRFCVDNQFDGVDIDWEHPSTDDEHRDYGALLGAIKAVFATHGLHLTIAVAGWQHLDPAAIDAADRLHLMAYDNEGRHSTYESAEADTARLLKKGVPAKKICLGVPFYGRRISDRAQDMTYAEISRKYKPGRDIDEIDGLYFNGAATIERKVRFAVSNKLAGVMVWEIGQDTKDESSLLRAMDRAAHQSHAPP